MDTVMTDYQYQTVLKGIKLIVRKSKTVEEIEEQIDYLLDKESETKKKEDKE